MPLQFEIKKEDYEKLDENKRGLYKEHKEGVYRLEVEGIDPADELKETLRKVREEKAEAKRLLKEQEDADAEKERKRLEEKQEFESLYKKEQEKNSKLEKDYADLKDSVANKERSLTATEVVSTLTKDEAKASLLKKEAQAFVTYVDGEVKINGPEGDAWDAQKLTDHLKTTYPFLVDGSQAAGGGAPGGEGGGATTKKFNELSGQELSAIREKDPGEYDRLRNEYYGTTQ